MMSRDDVTGRRGATPSRIPEMAITLPPPLRHALFSPGLRRGHAARARTSLGTSPRPLSLPLASGAGGGGRAARGVALLGAAPRP